MGTKKNKEKNRRTHHRQRKIEGRNRVYYIKMRSLKKRLKNK
jgi:hypothetical protein